MHNLKIIINSLGQFLTDERFELFHTVLNNRTRYITIVLEDIYQPHNASAVLRTSECFGIQDVHVIENRNKYNINPDVVLGSTKWINLIRHNQKNNNTTDTISALKNDGYRIIATTPHINDVSLDEFDLAKGKVALFFGTELNGLSNNVLDAADEFLKIPMYGFTESFNISVSAALILHELNSKMRTNNLNWQLTEYEKDIIMLKWLMSTIKKPDLLFNKVCKTKGINPDLIRALL